MIDSLSDMILKQILETDMLDSNINPEIAFTIIKTGLQCLDSLTKEQKIKIVLEIVARQDILEELIYKPIHTLAFSRHIDEDDINKKKAAESFIRFIRSILWEDHTVCYQNTSNEGEEASIDLECSLVFAIAQCDFAFKEIIMLSNLEKCSVDILSKKFTTNDGTMSLADLMVMRFNCFNEEYIKLISNMNSDSLTHLMETFSLNKKKEDDDLCFSLLAKHMDENILNYTFKNGYYRKQSVAFCLARHLSSDDFYIWFNETNKSHKYLIQLLKGQTLNHIIEDGEYAGQSVGFLLAYYNFFYNGHEDVFAMSSSEDSDEECLYNFIEPATLNHIIQQGVYAGQSMAFWLSHMVEFGQVLNLLNEEALNAVFVYGDYGGKSLAFVLTKDRGFLLNEDNYRLANLIHEDTLNNIISSKYPQTGNIDTTSVAFELAQLNTGLKTLTANNYRLANLIHADTLNHIFLVQELTKDTYYQSSIAFELSITEFGKKILAANNYRLANLIDEKTLNHIFFVKDSNKDAYYQRSIAFELSKTKPGRKILAANNYRLANLIDEKTLNDIFLVKDPNKGAYYRSSIAFELSKDKIGQEILAANDYRLANLIDEKTLNHIFFVKDSNKDVYYQSSIAFELAKTEIGHKILAAKDYRLAHLINRDPANHMIAEAELIKKNVALGTTTNHNLHETWKKHHAIMIKKLIFTLAASNSGQKILYFFANLIDKDTLNSTISEGPLAGQSLAFMLIPLENGRQILAANDYHLANLIDENDLNYVIPQGPCMGQSIAFRLTMSNSGRQILAANDYRLAKLIDKDLVLSIIKEKINEEISLDFAEFLRQAKDSSSKKMKLG
jgi:hypothetical protein